MKKIFVAIAIIVTFAGCRTVKSNESIDQGSSLKSTVSQQQASELSGDQSASSTGTNNGGESSQSNTTKRDSTSTTVKNGEDIDNVQSQLNELESILKDIDDISDSDLQIPNP